MALTTRNELSTLTAPQLGQVSADVTAYRRDFGCEQRMVITSSTELEEFMRERCGSKSSDSPTNRAELDMHEILRRVARAKPRVILIGECRDVEAAEAKLQHLLNA